MTRKRTRYETKPPHECLDCRKYTLTSKNDMYVFMVKCNSHQSNSCTENDALYRCMCCDETFPELHELWVHLYSSHISTNHVQLKDRISDHRESHSLHSSSPRAVGSKVIEDKNYEVGLENRSSFENNGAPVSVCLSSQNVQGNEASEHLLHKPSLLADHMNYTICKNSKLSFGELEQDRDRDKETCKTSNHDKGPHCDKYCAVEIELNHLTKNEDLFCPDKQINSEQDMIKHHTAETFFQCDKCNKSFKSEGGLQEHISCHFQPLKCLDCGKEFTNSTQLTSHMINGSQRRFKCVKCQNSLVNQAELESHNMQHINDKTHETEDYNTQYNITSGFADHKCKFCSKIFKTAGNLRQHLLTHSGERPFICTLCHAAFTQKSNLKRHAEIHRQDKQMTCDECGLTFAGPYKLVQHKKSHSSRFECEHCGRKFTDKKTQIKHQVIHTGGRPFKCSELGCDKDYRYPQDLRLHMKSHSFPDNIKPYHCFICRKNFKSLAYFNTHRRNHKKQGHFRDDSLVGVNPVMKNHKSIVTSNLDSLPTQKLIAKGGESFDQPVASKTQIMCFETSFDRDKDEVNIFVSKNDVESIDSACFNNISNTTDGISTAGDTHSKNITRLQDISLEVNSFKSVLDNPDHKKTEDGNILGDSILHDGLVDISEIDKSTQIKEKPTISFQYSPEKSCHVHVNREFVNQDIYDKKYNHVSNKGYIAYDVIKFM